MARLVVSAAAGGDHESEPHEHDRADDNSTAPSHGFSLLSVAHWNVSSQPLVVKTPAHRRIHRLTLSTNPEVSWDAARTGR
jgi:hypothetical protein